MYILDDSKINGLTLWLILITYIQEKTWPKKKTLIHQLTELPTNRLLLTNQQRHLKQARYSDPETEIKQAVWRRRWQTKDTDKTRQDKTRQTKQESKGQKFSYLWWIHYWCKGSAVDQSIQQFFLRCQVCFVWSFELK